MTIEVKYIVGITLMVLLLVVSFYAYSNFPTIIKNFNSYVSSVFKPGSYADVQESTRKQVEAQFDILARNINSCKASVRQGCLCKNVFPNFPNSFPEDFSLNINNYGITQGIRISLSYKTREEVKFVSMNKIFLAGLAISGNKTITKDTNAVYSITFKDNSTLFDGVKILSSGIYKESLYDFGTLIEGSPVDISKLSSC